MSEPMTDENLYDRSPIAVWWGDEECGYKVGYQGITSMKTIKVPGPMGFHPWIEVYRGDVLVARVNCSCIQEVRYR